MTICHTLVNHNHFSFLLFYCTVIVVTAATATAAATTTCGGGIVVTPPVHRNWRLFFLHFNHRHSGSTCIDSNRNWRVNSRYGSSSSRSSGCSSLSDPFAFIGARFVSHFGSGICSNHRSIDIRWRRSVRISINLCVARDE